MGSNNPPPAIGNVPGASFLVPGSVRAQIYSVVPKPAYDSGDYKGVTISCDTTKPFGCDTLEPFEDCKPENLGTFDAQGVRYV